MPRRSRRQAEATIDRFQRPDFNPETTSGLDRVWEAQNTMRAAEQEEADELVIAPDRELLPYLNRLLGKIYNLNRFIRQRPFTNTQPLETRIKNYTEILDQYITNVMGSFACNKC